MKYLWAATVGLAIIFSGCSKSGQHVVVMEWQRGAADACQHCDACGVSGDEIRAAAAQLRAKLAAKNVRVQVVERSASDGPPARPSVSRMWVCDIPLETWLGARAATTSCTEAKSAAAVRPAIYLDDKSYSVIPAELMVKAGVMAGNLLLEHGKVDIGLIQGAKGCAECPSKGKCGVDE